MRCICARSDHDRRQPSPPVNKDSLFFPAATLGVRASPCAPASVMKPSKTVSENQYCYTLRRCCWKRCMRALSSRNPHLLSPRQDNVRRQQVTSPFRIRNSRARTCMEGLVQVTSPSHTREGLATCRREPARGRVVSAEIKHMIGIWGEIWLHEWDIQCINQIVFQSQLPHKIVNLLFAISLL